MHGPSIVLCTQPIQRRDTIELTIASEDCGDEATGNPSKSQRVSVSGLSDCSEEPAEVDTFEHHDTALTSGTCSACRSFMRPNSGLVTYGDDGDLWYLTLQYPHSPEVFTFLRQACVRSLSSEVSPGREGPILFGDENHGYVYSNTFYLKDNEARGLQRWYSIVILVMDKMSLMQSWPLLTRFSRLLVNLLQKQAENVYHLDQADKPQRAARLGASSAINSANFRLQRRGKALRSLMELTGSSQVLSTVHEHFTNLLQLGGNQMSETMLEGSPSCHHFDSDGNHVVTEPYCGNESQRNSLDWGDSRQTVKKVSSGSFDQSSEPPSHDELFRILPRYTGLVHLHQALGKHSFRTLAHNLISGNQIIIRGFHDFLVASVIRALEILIPPGCRKIIYFSQTYHEPWNCNILGLHPDASLPDHILNNTDYFVVDVLAAKMNEMNVDKYKVITPSQLVPPVKPSSYLVLVEQILEDPEIPEEVVQSLIFNQHERQMSRVKVLYQLFRMERRNTEDVVPVMDKLRIPREDDGLLKFWMRALSDEYKAHLNELARPPAATDQKVFQSSIDLKKSGSLSQR
ncbi:Folliculin [Hypsibius exemplaris]|uniref:Folliculin n=1 Tax=Hypsibius exemplaris TaxID=2072580 RepID=A0A9X6NF70_HYPEX|nr:Folliculin [Hypsibius exemplaris]